VWVCLQGAFGALTVTMKLFPAIVTLHLLGGAGLLVLLCAQAVRHPGRGPARRPLALPLALRWAVGRHALVALQVALGGWVSTNYAVLACTTFPMCQGSWWPAMDFAQGFELWRPLGCTQDGSAHQLCRAHRHPLCAPPVGLCGVGRAGMAGLALLRAGAARRRAGSRALARCSWPPACRTWCSTGPCWPPCCTPAAPAALVVVLTWALLPAARPAPHFCTIRSAPRSPA
jgi:cytochrome c oxidase assembly protein subunit 15